MRRLAPVTRTALSAILIHAPIHSDGPGGARRPPRSPRAAGSSGRMFDAVMNPSRDMLISKITLGIGAPRTCSPTVASSVRTCPSVDPAPRRATPVSGHLLPKGEGTSILGIQPVAPESSGKTANSRKNHRQFTGKIRTAAIPQLHVPARPAANANAGGTYALAGPAGASPGPYLVPADRVHRHQPRRGHRQPPGRPSRASPPGTGVMPASSGTAPPPRSSGLARLPRHASTGRAAQTAAEIELGDHDSCLSDGQLTGPGTRRPGRGVAGPPGVRCRLRRRQREHVRARRVRVSRKGRCRPSG
jgi:hypothetical protein